MSFLDYSDSFTYTEKIVLDYAKELCDTVAEKVIDRLRAITEGLQSENDSGLTNLWQEISVQLQSEFSVMWDLYDEIVSNEIEKEVLKLPEHAVSAIQYSIDFCDCDSEYRCEYDEIVAMIKTEYVYDAATNNQEEAVKTYLGV